MNWEGKVKPQFLIDKSLPPPKVLNETVLIESVPEDLDPDVSVADFLGQRAIEYTNTAKPATELSTLNVSGVLQLKQAGYNVDQLKDLGHNTAELKEAGYSVADLKRTYTATEMRWGGYSAADLKDNGFDFDERRDAMWDLISHFNYMTLSDSPKKDTDTEQFLVIDTEHEQIQNDIDEDVKVWWDPLQQDPFGDFPETAKREKERDNRMIQLSPGECTQYYDPGWNAMEHYLCVEHSNPYYGIKSKIFSSV